MYSYGLIVIYFNASTRYILGQVKLIVRYTPKVLEEMEARFDKQRAKRVGA